MKKDSAISDIKVTIKGYLEYFRTFFNVLMRDNIDGELRGNVQKFIKIYEEQLTKTNLQYTQARANLKRILTKKIQLEIEIHKLTEAKTQLTNEFNSLSDDIKISHAITVNECSVMIGAITQKITNLKRQDEVITEEINLLAKDIEELSQAIMLQEEAANRISRVKRVAASSNTVLSSLKQKAEDGSLLLELKRLNDKSDKVENTLEAVIEQATGLEADLLRENLDVLKKTKIKKQEVDVAIEKNKKAKPILEELVRTIQADDGKKGELLDEGLQEDIHRRNVNRINQSISEQINADLKENALMVRRACLERLKTDPSEENYLGLFRILSSDVKLSGYLLFLAIEKGYMTLFKELIKIVLEDALNMKNMAGETLFHAIIKYDRLEMLARLLATNANVEQRNGLISDIGSTPLFYALDIEKPIMAQCILKGRHNVDINAVGVVTNKAISVSERQFSLVNLARSLHKDIFLQFFARSEPLDLFIKVDTLFAPISNIFNNKISAKLSEYMISYVRSYNAEILEYNANTSELIEHGYNLSDMALYSGHMKIYEAMKRQIPAKKEKLIELMIFLLENKSNRELIRRRFQSAIQEGVNLKSLLPDRFTLLHNAVRGGVLCEDFFEYSDKIGINATAHASSTLECHQKRTALHFAVMYNRLNIVKLLLGNGARIYAKAMTAPYYPAFYACDTEVSSSILHALVQQDVKVLDTCIDLQGMSGVDILEYAVCYATASHVEEILAAKKEFPNSSAYEIAYLQGKMDMLKSFNELKHHALFKRYVDLCRDENSTVDDLGKLLKDYTNYGNIRRMSLLHLAVVLRKKVDFLEYLITHRIEDINLRLYAVYHPGGVYIAEEHGITGISPLWLAIYEKKFDTVNLSVGAALIQLNAKITKQDLFLMINHFDIDTFRAALAKFTPRELLDFRDENGQTLLLNSIHYDRLEACKLLLLRQPELIGVPQDGNSGITPLAACVSLGRVVILEFLKNRLDPLPVLTNVKKGLKPLGSGQYGTVFPCEYDGISGYVIKQIRYIGDAGKAKAEKEVRALIAYRGWDYIIPIMGVVKDKTILGMEEAVGLVMPRCQYSLEAYLKKNAECPESISWDIRYRIAWQIGSALVVVKFHGKPHRDIKSANILLDDNHNAMLADFGEQCDEQGGTLHGAVRGTLQYLAPELFSINMNTGRFDYSEYSDIYAYGVTLWELATHEVPLANAQKDGVIKDIVVGGELRDEIPDYLNSDFKKIIESSWKTLPKERPLIENIVITLKKLKSDPVELKSRDVQTGLFFSARKQKASESVSSQDMKSISDKNLEQPGYGSI